MKQSFVAIVLILVCLNGYSQSDSLKTTVNWWNSLERYYDAVNITNPATTKASVKERFLNNTLSYSYIDRANIAQLEYGEVANNYLLNIEGYQKIWNSVVWGKASYEIDDVKGVQWNNNADFNKLYPYIIADSIGGNRMKETYLLSGGFNRRYATRSFGIEADYRAAVQYAKTNPRPLNTVSEFNIKLGVIQHLQNYNVGISGAYGNYHQELNVKMFGDRENTYIYFLRGFGLYQNRLSGNSSYHTNDYFGNNVNTSLSLRPVNSGFMARLFYQYNSIYHKESNANNGIEPFALKDNNIHADFGYKWDQDASSIEGKFNLKRNKRIGSETSYSFSGSEYEKLSTSTPFNHTVTDLSLSVLWNKQNTKALNTVEMYGLISYVNTDAFHLNDGVYRLFTTVNSLVPMMHYKLHFYKGNAHWTLNHLIESNIILNADEELPDELNTEDSDNIPLIRAINENYWRATQNLISTDLSLTYMYYWENKKSIGVESGMNIVSNGAATNLGANVSLIYNF